MKTVEICRKWFRDQFDLGTTKVWALKNSSATCDWWVPTECEYDVATFNGCMPPRHQSGQLHSSFGRMGRMGDVWDAPHRRTRPTAHYISRRELPAALGWHTDDDRVTINENWTCIKKERVHRRGQKAIPNSVSCPNPFWVFVWRTRLVSNISKIQ